MGGLANHNDEETRGLLNVSNPSSANHSPVTLQDGSMKSKVTESPSVELIDGNKSDGGINNNDTNNKMGATSFWGFTMIVVGTLMYGIFTIINRLSMLGQKSTPYQSAAAMAIAELGKFLASSCLLINEVGLNRSFIIVKNQTFIDWVTFAIPAALYSFTNNLDFYILQYMDPGSMQV